MDLEIKKILENHEKRISVLEGKRIAKSDKEEKSWYKKGSTAEKLVLLVKNRFLKEPRSISEIIAELKTKDYHLRASDLTLPLRRIVRKGLLTRTKKKTDGSQSKIWLYKQE